ncbi:elongation factor 1-delta isoform 2-T2 [Pelodytes ibericus]
MRTRKHQSPAEPAWIDKHKHEGDALVSGEVQPVPAAPCKGREAPNGVSQYDSGENCSNVEQKKTNVKKQKRRKRSPRNKSQPRKVDAVLIGLMADEVWLDRQVYEEAECAYYAALANNQAKALGTKPSLPDVDSSTQSATGKTAKNLKNPAAWSCQHNSLTACHHVDNGVWINKFHFDDAEMQFASQFVSPLAPRDLELPLVSHETQGVQSMQRMSDEGYVSATPTPAAQEMLAFGVGAVTPTVASASTVNGKPHWSGLQDLIAEVWLEKQSFDWAERHYYESLAVLQSVPSVETNPHWSLNSGKKGKREKWNRKSSGKQQHAAKKRDLASIPEENGGLLNPPVYYFLHQDSENVWLNKPTYDLAEAKFYAAQSLHLQHAAEKKPASATKPPKAAKCRRRTTPCRAKTMADSYLCTEKIWIDKFKYDDAEREYYENLSKKLAPDSENQQQDDGASTILRDIARARENIQKSLAGLRTVLHNPREAPPSLPSSQSGPSASTAAAPASNEDNGELLSRVASLEQENQSLHKVVKDLQLAISKLENRINTLEKSATSNQSSPGHIICKVSHFTTVTPVQEENEADDDDDDDIDLFGSDEEEEDAEAARVREERLREYAQKKSKKPGLIAKSSILLDVKPWDDETDMAKLEECVRTVQMDGLLWGSSKLVPVGYGIKKLQIQCVVEDDKVGTDILEEEITKFEDYVQSVDIAAFNKI